MTRTHRIVHALVAVAALTATALLAAACARQPTASDPSYTTPEGSASDRTRLMVWPEGAAVTAVFRDNPPFGPDPSDELTGQREYFARPAGTVNGLVLDGTLANQFQIMRRETNGAVRPLFDFALPPTRRWPDLGWDAFRFFDASPPTGATPAYVARGLVNGAPATYSPLSNFAESTAGAVAPITLHFPTDTTATWDAVPGAAYYVSQVFQFRLATPSDQVLASAPQPMVAGKSLDFFVGISTEPRVVGRNQPFDGVVLTRRDMPPGEYLFTVSAIDLAGKLIARCVGDSETVQSEVEYERYAQGAAALPRPRIESGPSRLSSR